MPTQSELGEIACLWVLANSATNRASAGLDVQPFALGARKGSEALN